MGLRDDAEVSRLPPGDPRIGPTHAQRVGTSQPTANPIDEALALLESASAYAYAQAHRWRALAQTYDHYHHELCYMEGNNATGGKP